MTNQRRRSVSHFFRYRNRDRLRVNVPHHCLKQFDEIKNHLKLRSHRGAVDWLLVHDMKGLVELTNELGYGNGGQTIDWLLAMGMGTERILNFRQGQIVGQTVNLSLPSETRALVELTRELGFNRGEETVDWLLQMATNPMIELMNSLGFKSGTKTIDWLWNQAQPNIAAAKLNGFKPSEPPKLSSAVNITPQFPSKQLKTPGFQTAEFHNFSTQPHNQLESNHGQRFTEKQQQVQFDNNGSGDFAERHFFNANGGLSNRSRGVMRGRQEAKYSNHAGNHLQILDPFGHRGSETQIGRASTNSAQGLRQNPNIRFDVVYVEHVQNNSIINGNTSQQNEFSGQPPDPKALLDFYFANLNLVDNMDPQSVLKIFYAQNQKQFINNHTQNHNQFVNSHDQNQNHFENIQPQSQFENIHTQNQNQFVNNHAQNQNQFVNGHDQNQNLYENIHPESQFENIHAQNQNQLVNIHAQNQNHFVNIQDQNQSRLVNIHDQNQGGYQGNQGGNSGSFLSHEEQKNAGTINNWFVNGLAP